MLWQQSNDAASAEQHNKGLGMAVPKRTRKIILVLAAQNHRNGRENK